MSNYYSKHDKYREKFYRVPKVFFTNPTYITLSDSAKLAYSLLLDRQELSIKNEWYDSKGHIYFIYTIEELAKILMNSRQKTSNIKKELIKAKLLEVKKRGQGLPDMLYLLRPEVTDQDIYLIDEAETLGAVEKSKNEMSRNTEIRPLDISELERNDTDINKTDNNKTEKNLNHNPEKDINSLKLPMEVKRIIYQKNLFGYGYGIPNNDSLDPLEIEKFYNTSVYIKNDVDKFNPEFINDFEFYNIVRSIIEKGPKKIERTYGILHSYVLSALNFKKDNADYMEIVNSSDSTDEDLLQAMYNMMPKIYKQA